MSPPLWVFPGAAGDDLAPSEGAVERGIGGIEAGWAVRVLPHAAGGAGRVRRRAASPDDGNAERGRTGRQPVRRQGQAPGRETGVRERDAGGTRTRVPSF